MFGSTGGEGALTPFSPQTTFYIIHRAQMPSRSPATRASAAKGKQGKAGRDRSKTIVIRLVPFVCGRLQEYKN